MNKNTLFLAAFICAAAIAFIVLSASGAFLKLPFIYNKKFSAVLPNYLQLYQSACAQGGGSGTVASGKIAPFEVSTYNPMNAGHIELTADSLVLKLLPKQRIASNPKQAETLVVRKLIPAYSGAYTPDGKAPKSGFGNAECLKDDYEVAIINLPSGGCSVYHLEAVGECAKVIEKKTMDSSNYHLKVPDTDVIDLLKYPGPLTPRI